MVQLLTLVFLAASGAAIPAPIQNIIARAEPTTFTANDKIGAGGTTFKDSNHFRVYAPGVATATVDNTLDMLEAAYDCFVGNLGWRSTGLSYNFNTAAQDAAGPWYKTNVYTSSDLNGAGGVMRSDATTGMGYLEVLPDQLAIPQVTVHEFGHAMTYHEQKWVDQGNTGAWWETTAQWVADTYATSDLCAAARAKYGQSTSATEMNVNKVLGDSFQVMVDGTSDSGNYYEAWPFFTYLTNNPDNLAGLGKDTVKNLLAQYTKNSNETPLHSLSRVSTNASVATLVGKYWARMAYLDIGHAAGQAQFLAERSTINFANVDLVSTGNYKVKTARQPRYMGANIIPLKVSGVATVTVKLTCAMECKATLAVRNTSSGAVKYTELANGAGSAAVASGEEASLVVANAPATLIVYDGFALSSAVSKGLDYSFTISGATV